VGDADRVEQEWAAKTSPDQQPGLSFILVDSLCQGITPHPGAHSGADTVVSQLRTDILIGAAQPSSSSIENNECQPGENREKKE